MTAAKVHMCQAAGRDEAFLEIVKQHPGKNITELAVIAGERWPTTAIRVRNLQTVELAYTVKKGRKLLVYPVGVEPIPEKPRRGRPGHKVAAHPDRDCLGLDRRLDMAEIDRSVLAHLPASANDLAMVCNCGLHSIHIAIKRLGLARIGNVYQAVRT